MFKKAISIIGWKSHHTEQFLNEVVPNLLWVFVYFFLIVFLSRFFY